MTAKYIPSRISRARSLARLATLAIVLGSMGIVSPAKAANANWINTGTDWNTNASWDAAFPTTGNTATFNSAMVTNPNISSSLSIGGIATTVAGSGYDVTGSPGVTLTITNATLFSLLNTSGTNTIDVPLIFNRTTGQAISQAAGGTLVINGDISSTNSNLITFFSNGSAGGTVRINGTNNSYSGGSFITGTGSRVVITKLGNAGGNGSLGTGSITLGNGTNQTSGYLQYVGAGETSGKNFIFAPSNTTSSNLNATFDTTGSTGALVLNGTFTVTPTGGTGGTPTLQLTSNNTFGDTMAIALTNGTATSLKLWKSGYGNWTLNQANTYTGATTIQAGSLILDFAGAGAPTSNILASGNVVTMASGLGASVSSLVLKGAAGVANTQTLGNLGAGTGAQHINLTAGAGGSTSLVLGTLPGLSITGSVVDFSIGANTSVTTTSVSAATGTSSGLFAGAITVNGNDFATNNGNAANPIVGLSTIAGAYDNSTLVTTTLARPLDVVAATTVNPGTVLTVPGLRFNAAGANTLTIGAGKSMGIASNSSILVTSNVGANTTAITGGTLSGVSARALNIIQNNTAGSLTIDSAISNTSIAKYGPGLAVLSGSSAAAAGKTMVVNEGTLQFGKQVSLYNNDSTQWTATQINVANGAALALNVGGTGEFTTSDVAIVSGLGTTVNGFQSGSRLALDTTNAGGTFAHTTAITNANALGLQKLGTGGLTLATGNTYSGGTFVTAGSLLLDNASTLQGATGAVTVNGGTLTSNVANSNLGGALALTSGVLAENGSGVGSLTLATGNLFTMTGGLWSLSFTSTSSYDQLLGSGLGSFSLTGGTLDLTSSIPNYAASYQILSGFAPGTVSGLSFINYNSSFIPTLSNAGVLSFTAVPEPSTWALLIGAIIGLPFLARRRRTA